MSVPALVIGIVLLAILLEDAVQRRERPSRWRWFVLWALAGFGGFFAAVSFALGLLVLPLVIVLLFAVSRVSGWPDSIGFVAGIGVSAGFVGVLNLGEPHQATYLPWLVVGAVLATLSAAWYAAVAK